MRKLTKVALFGGAVVAVFHSLVVFFLGNAVQSFESGNPIKHIAILLVWILTQPMNSFLNSSTGKHFSMTTFYMLFWANSLIWGIAVMLILVWRWRKSEDL